MTEHELLKKKLENYNLISSIDYNRSCGALGYTDMSIKKVGRNRTTQSKFYISMNIDNKPQILYLNNLEILYEELNVGMFNQIFGSLLLILIGSVLRCKFKNHSKNHKH